MGEARRRLQSGVAEGLTSEQLEFLRGLAAWNDSSPWEAPPAVKVEAIAADVMFYLVDTLNLWNVVGCVSLESAEKLFATAQRAPSSIYQRAPGLAGSTLKQASARNAKLGDSVCQDALTFAAFYMACTETYSQATQEGEGVCGHWVVLLYHLGDGSSLVRPLFVRATSRQKLGPQAFVGVVKDVVAHDLHSESASLSQRIHAAGGLRLAELLKRGAGRTDA